MPVEESVDPSVPAQWRAHTIYDFRNMPDGPRGYKVQVTKKGHLGSKRKLDEYTEQVEKEQMETAMVIEDDGQRQQSKKQKLKASMMPTNQNTVGVGKTSGRSWKISGQKASSMRSGASKNMSTSWEKKMRDKAVLKEVRDRRREALEKEKAKRREAREKREAAKKRKEENRKKSAVTQVVSTETAKKMAKNKKLRKKLVTVDG